MAKPRTSFPLLLFAVLVPLLLCSARGSVDATLTRAIHYAKYESSGIRLDTLERTKMFAERVDSSSSSSSSISDNETCADNSSLCSGHMGGCCMYDEIQNHVSAEEYAPFEDIWTCIRSNYTCCPASDGYLKGCPPDRSTCCIWGDSLKTLSFGCCDGKCSNKPGWCNEGLAKSGAPSLRNHLAALLYVFLP